MTEAPYRPGYELAAERILEHVARHDLGPGDRLPTERELAGLLGVSRTVTHDAVRSLAALGRLSVRKGAGIFVATAAAPLGDQVPYRFLPADPDQVYQLFELRHALESQASALAARRATPAQVKAIREAVARGIEAAEGNDFALFRRSDDDFHLGVARAAHNQFLESTIGWLTQLRHQVITIGLSGGGSGSLRGAVEQHRAVLDAIAEADPDGAAAAMSEHIEVSRDQFQKVIQERMSLDAEQSWPGLTQDRG